MMGLMNRSVFVKVASLGLIFTTTSVLAGCLEKNPFRPSPATLQPASLSLSPRTSSFKAGEETTVSLDLDSGGQPIDAFDVEISYDQQLVEVVSLEPQPNAFGQYPINETDGGKIRLVGLAAAGPSGPSAFTGQGPVATIRLRFLQAGEHVTLIFAEKSIVASKGKNVLGESLNGDYQVSQ